MSKTIIWIDDREDEMEKVAKGAFVELWKEGIISRVAFLGNAFPDNTCDDPIFFVEEEIIGNFQRFKYSCENQVGGFAGIDKKIVEEVDNELKKHEEKKEYLAFCIPNNNQPELKERISKTLTSWEKKKSISLENWNNKQYNLEEIYSVKSIFDSIENPQNFVYALDIILLKNDDDKLSCDIEKAEPILSLELYHYIREELKAPCLLYTRYSYLNRLRDNWISLYSQRYSDIEIDSIVSRENLNLGSIDDSTINKLKGLCSKG